MLFHHLRIIFNRSTLDDRLAEGESTLGDPALALRAAQLCSPRTRRRVASGLERALADSGRRGITAAIPLDRHAVTAARPYLAQIAVRLRSPRPVAPHGVARALRLLTDGSAPLYAPSTAADLRHEASLVLFWLEPAPQSPDPSFSSADHPNLAP